MGAMYRKDDIILQYCVILTMCSIYHPSSLILYNLDNTFNTSGFNWQEKFPFCQTPFTFILLHLLALSFLIIVPIYLMFISPYLNQGKITLAWSQRKLTPVLLKWLFISIGEKSTRFSSLTCASYITSV